MRLLALQDEAVRAGSVAWVAGQVDPQRFLAGPRGGGDVHQHVPAPGGQFGLLREFPPRRRHMVLAGHVEQPGRDLHQFIPHGVPVLAHHRYGVVFLIPADHRHRARVGQVLACDDLPGGGGYGLVDERGNAPSPQLDSFPDLPRDGSIPAHPVPPGCRSGAASSVPHPSDATATCQSGFGQGGTGLVVDRGHPVVGVPAALDGNAGEITRKVTEPGQVQQGCAVAE